MHPGTQDSASPRTLCLLYLQLKQFLFGYSKPPDGKLRIVKLVPGLKIIIIIMFFFLLPEPYWGYSKMVNTCKNLLTYGHKCRAVTRCVSMKGNKILELEIILPFNIGTGSNFFLAVIWYLVCIDTFPANTRFFKNV